MKRQIELYFYEGDGGDLWVANKQPIIRLGESELSNAEDCTSTTVCAEALQVFGINKPPKDNEVIKLTLAIESAEIGTAVTQVDFQSINTKRHR